MDVENRIESHWAIVHKKKEKRKEEKKKGRVVIPFFNVHMWVCVNVSVDLVNKKKKKTNKQNNR